MGNPSDTPMTLRAGADAADAVLGKHWVDPNLDPLSNDDLVSRLKGLVKVERGASALVVAHLIEFGKRKLYAPLGFSSLFGYCTRELGYSEDAACKRINAARAAAQFPAILGMLELGRIHLAAVGILAPVLTQDNHKHLLELSVHRSKRELEALLAEILPESERPDSARSTAPGRVRISFSADERLRTQLERAIDLRRHKHPSGAYDLIFSEALELLLQRILLEPSSRSTQRGRPGQGSRAIPRRLKEAIWKRDGGACAFLSSDGRRCEESGWLEFDHIVPWALGGSSTDPANIRLLCRTHNQFCAREVFGEAAIKSPRIKSSAPGRMKISRPGLKLTC